MTIETFNSELLATASEYERRKFIQKHLFHGTPFVFQDGEDKYFEFRNRIAQNFSIGFYEVFIVGSAKFGFSYWKHKNFDLDSDIDVVIVNERLFEEFYKKICDYQYDLDRFYKTISIEERKKYYEFLRYLIKGWMRPDLLPTSFQIGLLKKEWWDFFNSISNNKSEVGNYEVKAGLYKNYYFLEKYHLTGIESYCNNIRNNKE